MERVLKAYHRVNREIGFKLLVLAFLIGLLGGLASLVFQFFLENFYYLFIIGPQAMLTNRGLESLAWTPFIVSPIIGGVIVGYMINNLAIEAKGHGIPQIIEAYHHQDGRVRTRVPLVKILASALTISSGGSAGREGPIAQIGAGLGSLISQKLDLSVRETRVLLISGLAAGVSATFNAPIGAALFSLEVIRPRVSLKIFPVILISSIVGYIVRLFSIGFNLILDPANVITFVDLHLIPLYVLLGLVTGVASGLWIKVFYGIEHNYVKILNELKIPKGIQPVFGRVIVGVALCIIYFRLGSLWPQYSLIGNTLAPIRYVLNGTSLNGAYQEVLYVLTLVMVLKIIVTPMTLASGGSGGVFAPTLFIGAYLGGIYGVVCRQFFGVSELNVLTIALVGMAGLFAGTCRAPITSIVMTTEMTGTYLIAVPLVITTMIGYIISSMIEREDIYSMELKGRGVYIKFFSLDKLAEATVKNNMIKRDNLRVLYIDTPVYLANKRTLHSSHSGLPVFDGDVFVGIITRNDIMRYIDEHGKEGNIQDLLASKQSKEVICVSPETSLEKTYNIMRNNNISNLPVMEKGMIIGWITKEHIEDAFETGFDEVSLEGGEGTVREEIGVRTSP